MKLLFVFIFLSFSLNANSNEPFVVLEYQGAMGSNNKLNKNNIFVKNQNHSVQHKIKNGESLSGILKRYYGNSGLNMKIVEISLIEINKHAFVRGNPHFMFAGKKLKIPSINEIMNLVKASKQGSTNSNNSLRNGHIYFYGN